jgi:hypothetical protein
LIPKITKNKKAGQPGKEGKIMFTAEQQRTARAFFAVDEALTTLCGPITVGEPESIKLWEETIGYLRIVKANISQLHNAD